MDLVSLRIHRGIASTNQLHLLHYSKCAVG